VAPAKPVYKFAASPKPKPSDPLLAPGDWGYHSLYKYETEVSQNTTSVTNALIDSVEDLKLEAEQATRLRRIFKNSARVRHVVDAEGGDSSDASYTVMWIQATAEGSVGTPWASAILRATFGTGDGAKALEVSVYRQRTYKGLDNRPLVAYAVVGYLAPNADGTPATEIVNPKPVKF
jgi:hypothetical protein